MDLIVGRLTRCSSLLLRATSVELNPLARHLYCFNIKVQNYPFHDKLCNKQINCGTNFLSSNINKCQIIPAIRENNKVSYCTNLQNDSKETKVSLMQRLKQMVKDYWYITIPVHLITSAFWVTVLYVSLRNGVDFIEIMQMCHLSETYIDTLRNSSAGHWVMTYAMYKIITPIRYTVTIGGTTTAIRYLNKWGYLKLKDSKQKTR